MSQKRIFSYYLIQKANVFIMIIAILSSGLFSVNTESEEESIRMLHIASTGNTNLLCLNESIYYLENHQTLLGNYCVLYRVDNDRLIKTTSFDNYGYFAGIYNGRIVIRLVESSFTNYPITIQYTLYNPITASKEEMPDSVTRFLRCNSNIMLRGYGNFMIANLDGSLYSYDSSSGQLKAIDDCPFEFVNLGSSFCFAMRDETSYYIYPIEDVLRVKINNTLSAPALRYPETNRFFYLCGPSDALRLEEHDFLDEKIESFNEELNASYALLVLSADLQGDFLYIVTRTSVKRYDLQHQAFDQGFEFKLEIPETAYITDIIICENRILYVVHNNSRNSLYIDTLNRQI